MYQAKVCQSSRRLAVWPVAQQWQCGQLSQAKHTFRCTFGKRRVVCVVDEKADGKEWVSSDIKDGILV